jgi:hypothetical protein
MERINSKLCGYIFLEHKATGQLYAVSRDRWNKFLATFNSVSLSGKLPDLNVVKLQKNKSTEYDLSEIIETINYKFLRGSFRKDLKISCSNPS